jgi:fermentation-respiration switch protein FrsA (DUF1100 family)
MGSGRDEIEAWIHRPSAAGPYPAVVMGHGLGAVKAGGLDSFAERFCAAGFAAVVIDYRHWGGSDGQPRDVVNVRRQRDDYEAAVKWARSQPDIDASRIFVWGTSFSGLHATALAASDSRLAGAIAQCPLVDGLAGSLLVRPTRSIALFATALLDAFGSVIGRKPWYIPITVAPGQWGVTDTDDALFGQRLVAPREAAEWRNRVAARSLLRFPMQRPARRAADIAIPFLLVVAETDTQAPVDSALSVAARAPHAELRRSDGGHYDVYEGGIAFEKVVGWEVEFLRRHAGLKNSTS